ncbi:hypothetical protein EHV15_01805 [Paenibacillus oralis]|uniref:Uncharacterized protein n=1 Tax=Paenibacillus oralis TaxID=2490856 RepID=A0A3P3TX80_9BACL|nr:SUKH-4 family immunity protein [Paenibacillus oralis]RRJ61848.1 hypothetical protein EHV15_01805 [Paenibacillus oralis]
MNVLSKDFWDCEFFKYRKEDLDRFGFIEETKALLLAHGLPKNHSIFDKRGIQFFDCADFAQVVFNKEEFIRIGQSRGAFISIQKRTQEVYAIPESGLSNGGFINSNIKWFLLFHQLFYAELGKVDNIDDDKQCERFGNMLRREFEKMDPCAMLDKESTWSRIVEEYENGVV